MKKISLLALTAIIFAACNNQKAPSELQGISLSKSELSMEMGETKKLVVIYEPEDAEAGAPKVIWESTKERVATVDENGKVTAKQKGRATIVASCGKFAAECKVEVSTGGSTPVVPPDPSKFSVSTKEINSPADGGTFTIDVTANIAWSASCEESWASISPNNGDGNATVTVTVEPNTAEKADEQDITFTAGEFTEYVTIRRAGKDKDPEPEKEHGFSVSSTKQVIFSPGNLQYKPSNNWWTFATNQYDFAGKNNENIGDDNYDDMIDLFCWGHGDQPTYVGHESGYASSWSEFGNNKITGAGSDTWYTMSKDQWEYILSGRENAQKLQSLGKISNIKGYFLLPDDWVKPDGITFVANSENYTDNAYSYTEWDKMEKAGAVFLPEAGSRDRHEIDSGTGWYWTTTPKGDDSAYFFHFSGLSSEITRISSCGRYFGMSIRLVKTKKD